MPTLYVVRHAEPAVEGVLLGQADPPLSPVGREQAALLGNLLPPVPVYCSPLRRAKETAECFAEKIISLPELAEISYGEWDGISWAQIEEKWPELARQKLQHWPRITPPGGEAWSDFEARVKRALAEVLRHSLPAVIVAHSAVNSILAAEIAGGDSGSYKQQYTEIIKYEL